MSSQTIYFVKQQLKGLIVHVRVYPFEAIVIGAPQIEMRWG